MALRRKVFVALAVAVLGLAAWPVLSHYRAKARLAGYKAHLQARGEKLTIPELAPRLSPEIIAAGRELVRVAAISIPSSNIPPTMRYAGEGRAWAICREPVLPTEETTNLWAVLDTFIPTNEALLTQLHRVMDTGQFGFQLAYQQGFGLLLPHLTTTKNAAQWLVTAAMYELHVGNQEKAFAHLRSLIRLGANYREEPLIISSLVRIAIQNIALAATWQALQMPVLSETQWAEIQKEWERADLLPQAAQALSMERAMGAMVFEDLRSKYQDVSGMGTATPNSGLAELAAIGNEVLNDPLEGLRQFTHRYPAYWAWVWWGSYEDERLNATLVQAAIDAARQAEKDTNLVPIISRLESQFQQIRKAHPKAGRWMPQIIGVGDLVPNTYTRLAATEIQRSLVLTAIALERHRLRHGRHPADLLALVPEFTSAIPRDVCDGQTVRYRPGTNALFLLYSVGFDGLDQNGDTTLSPEKRLWYHGRDAVWPAAATPEQVAESLATSKTLKRMANEYRQLHQLPIPPER